MRLFEAILEANHRAAAGDPSAGLRPADYADDLPVVALTCIDVRLNPLMPEVLGIPEDQFIWLRNAGNIITSPISSTMRSMALACAVKGGREIAIIGHTDCQISKSTSYAVLERLQKMGVRREALPDNINEFFGMFASERANVLKAVGLVRASPLIGPAIPVHGLVVDVDTGRLEWLINGYESLGQNLAHLGEKLGATVDQAKDMLKNLADFNLGNIKFPDIKIGELASTIEHLSDPHETPQPQPPAVHPVPQQPAPPKLPLPLPAKPKLTFKRSPK
jgi:carbonic anhydrase